MSAWEQNSFKLTDLKVAGGWGGGGLGAWSADSYTDLNHVGKATREHGGLVSFKDGTPYDAHQQS